MSVTSPIEFVQLNQSNSHTEVQKIREWGYVSNELGFAFWKERTQNYLLISNFCFWQWTHEEFLSYLDILEKSVKERPGYTKTWCWAQKHWWVWRSQVHYNRALHIVVFASWSPYIYIEVHNATCVVFSTTSNVKVFLSQQICEDPLENLVLFFLGGGGVNSNVVEHTVTPACKSSRRTCRIWR